MKLLIVLVMIPTFWVISFSAINPSVPDEYDRGIIELILRNIDRRVRNNEVKIYQVEQKVGQTPELEAYQIMTTPNDKQTGTNMEQTINNMATNIYNIQMSTGGVMPSNLIDLLDTPNSYDSGKYLRSWTSSTTWDTVATGVGAGDNLGNHIATTTLNMSNYAIINASSVFVTGTGDAIPLRIRGFTNQTNPLLRLLDSAGNVVSFIDSDTGTSYGGAYGSAFKIQSFNATKRACFDAINDTGRYCEVGMTGTSYSAGVGANKAYFRAFDGSAYTPLYITDGNMNLTTLYVGAIGAGGTTTPPAGGIRLAGTGNPTLVITGAGTLEFGAGLTKETNAGKIGYGTFTSETLDIVGAGTSNTNRKIKFWAEGGATFSDNISCKRFYPSAEVIYSTHITQNVIYSTHLVSNLDARSKGLYASSSTWSERADTMAGYSIFVATYGAQTINGDLTVNNLYTNYLYSDYIAPRVNSSINFKDTDLWQIRNLSAHSLTITSTSSFTGAVSVTTLTATGYIESSNFIKSPQFIATSSISIVFAGENYTGIDYYGVRGWQDYLYLDTYNKSTGKVGHSIKMFSNDNMYINPKDNYRVHIYSTTLRNNTITETVLPTTDNLYDCGNATYRWKSVGTSYLNATSSATIGGTIIQNDEITGDTRLYLSSKGSVIKISPQAGDTDISITAYSTSTIRLLSNTKMHESSAHPINAPRGSFYFNISDYYVYIQTSTVAGTGWRRLTYEP